MNKRQGIFLSRAILVACVSAGIGLLQSAHAAQASPLRCDDSIRTHFKPDRQTSVVAVHAFHKGDVIALSGDTPPAYAPRAKNDLCLVKLNVGPGHPGAPSAPSTSKGIGIEIWLPMPAQWNGRIHAIGGGGFQGGVAGVADQVGSPFMAAMVADNEGAVSSMTDAGHASVPKNYGIPDSSGDFLMQPDGTINTTLWEDFSVRAIHEQALKTKALTQAFFGRPAKYAYWEGTSTGGRQGYKLAQAHPDDFDGIIANLPAMHWSKFIPAMVYPQLVFERDLGGKALTLEQQDLVSNAAIHACDVVGGEHLGYIMDPARCDYDPTQDKNVLCESEGGNNRTTACVTKLQAQAFNKIWYGITTDGSVPDPATDNGWSVPLADQQHWYGLTRGTSLWNAYFTNMLGRPAGVTNPGAPQYLGLDQLALQGQDASLAGPSFRNASTTLRDGWKKLSYPALAAIAQKGESLQPQFAHIDTNNPDLSAFANKGGKLLSWHGLNDEVIPVQGSIQYYDSVVATLGSLETVQDFYRLYLVPGAGHESPNGTSNPLANPPIFKPGQMYGLLVNWVEQGVAPDRVELVSPLDKPVLRRQPVCPYPQRAIYTKGDPNLAASFVCQP